MGAMTEHQNGTLLARLTRVLGFKTKSTRAAELQAAREQEREIERVGEQEHGHTEDEGEHGGHRYLRP
jgi:hypothetical protein